MVQERHKCLQDELSEIQSCAEQNGLQHQSIAFDAHRWRSMIIKEQGRNVEMQDALKQALEARSKARRAEATQFREMTRLRKRVGMLEEYASKKDEKGITESK